jgi:dynactin-4
MLVSYTYRSDDPAPSEGAEGASAKTTSKAPEVKTFSFYTVVELGGIAPKEEVRADLDA